MAQLVTIPFSRRFYAPLLSLATLLHLSCIAACVILPLFLSYASQSFWITANSYIEQPSVTYRREFILFFDGVALSESGAKSKSFSFTWASDARFNAGRANRSVVVKSYDVDNNWDGIVDTVSISGRVPCSSSEIITTVRGVFTFDANLQNRVRLSPPAAAFVETSVPSVVSLIRYRLLNLVNDFVLHQDNTVPPPEYSFLVDLGPPFQLNFKNGTFPLIWDQLRSDYISRSVRMAAKPVQISWLPQPTSSLIQSPSQSTLFQAGQNDFVFSMKLRIPPATIQYQPGVAETLKSAWIQYFSLAGLITAILWPTWRWMIIHQVVRTHVIADRTPGHHPGAFKGHAF
ncbi:transmembrane protein [Cladochytrium replicatum]|nr:transmembrane protein [Cladochytrium replicatum]